MGDITVRTSKLAALPRSKALRERYGGGVAAGQAGAGLSGAYLTVAEFATYFRKVGSEDGESSLIEAQLPLYSLGEVAAFGAGSGTPDGGSAGGGIDEERLGEWMAERGYATQAWVASRGFLTAGALDGFLREHQSLSHLVTLGTDQTVTGVKTLAAGLRLGGDVVTLSGVSVRAFTTDESLMHHHRVDLGYHGADRLNVYEKEVRFYPNGGGTAYLAAGAAGLEVAPGVLGLGGAELRWDAAAAALGTDCAVVAGGDVVAFGPAAGSTAAGGGIDEERLAEWMAEKGYATQAWVASRGFLTAGALDGFLKEHQSLSHLVTLGTDQTVTGAKTFTQAVTARASAPFVGQNPLADRKLQLDAFENWGAMRLYGTGGNYVNLRPLTTGTGAMLTHNDDGGAWDWDIELQVGRIALMDGSMYLDGGFASRLWWDAESARVRINRPLVSSGIMYAERFFADTTNICTNLNADLLDGKHLADILASNVASATKLQTARKLWGQNFDGTGDVDGRLTVNMTLANTTWVSDSGQMRLNTDSGKYSLGLGVASTGSAAIQSGEHGVGAIPLLVNPNGGNVGIRTSNPTEALHVHGTARFNAVKLPDGSGVTWDSGAVMWYDAAGDCFRVNRPVVATGDVTAFS